MKILFIAVGLLFSSVFGAERPVWGPRKKQILLWPEGAPGEVAGADLESVETVSKPVAGKVWTAMCRGQTMTLHEVKGKNTRAAVVVFPGAGSTYWRLI